jgi:hypothetical protein
MEVIDKVDAVILMGGRKGVVHAGTSAWMMRKVVLPIGCFGGGGEKVGRYGSSRRAAFYHGALTDEEIDRLASPWGVGLTAELAVSAMERIQRLAARKRIGSLLVLGVTALMVTALLCWVAGLVLPFVLPSVTTKEWPPHWSFPLLFPTVVAAGTFGSCVKNLRAIQSGTETSGRSAVMDPVLGVAAGMMVAILYLLAQIGVTGEVEVVISTQDYARVSIIITMAALFAGLYLDRAFAYFDEVGESVIKGKLGRKGK